MEALEGVAGDTNAPRLLPDNVSVSPPRVDSWEGRRDATATSFASSTDNVRETVADAPAPPARSDTVTVTVIARRRSKSRGAATLSAPLEGSSRSTSVVSRPSHTPSPAPPDREYVSTSLSSSVAASVARTVPTAAASDTVKGEGGVVRNTGGSLVFCSTKEAVLFTRLPTLVVTDKNRVTLGVASKFKGSTTSRVALRASTEVKEKAVRTVGGDV
jgi:hypothetical protein